MANIGSLVIDLLLSTASFDTDLDRQAKALKKRVAEIGRDAQTIGKRVAQGALATASAFTIMVKSAINTADDLRDLGQATGVSVANLSELEHAAHLSGAGIEDVATAFRRLTISAIESKDSNSKAAAAFKALGVSATNADGSLKGSEELLLDIADGFSKFADGSGKAAVGQALLGRNAQKLIPLLNEGRAGIEAFKDEARALGLTITDETAAAADEFNDNLTRLKGGITGIAREASARLLPTLVGITDQLVEFAKDGDAVNKVVDQIEAGFKALISLGVAVKIVFDVVGGAIGTLAGAAAKLTKGLTAADFVSPARLLFKVGQNAIEAGDAFDHLGEGFGDIADQVGKDVKFIDGLWNGFDETLNEVVVTAKKIKPVLKFGDEETSKAVAKATKTLEEFRQGLLEQVATFGLGEAAATKYRLEFGNLSDEVKKSGEKGLAIKDGILAAANFKQAQEDTKLLGEAITDINIQLDELAGKDVSAALSRFDQQNAELRKTIARSGTAADKEKLDALRVQIGAQAEFNQLQKEAGAITDELAREEERIRNTQETGALTELDSLLALDEARKKALVQLEAIHAKQKEIAAQSGNPALIEGAQKAGAEIDALAAQTDLLAKKLRSGFEDAGTDAFAGWISGAQSAGDAFDQFIGDIEKQITALVAKQLVQKLFSSFFGQTGNTGAAAAGGGSGGGTDYFALIASLFGGGKAYGGPVAAGTMYRVNEREPEFFKPNVGGKVVPLSQMGNTGGQVTQNINVRGDVTEKSAQQLAVETARRQRAASSRLG